MNWLRSLLLLLVCAGAFLVAPDARAATECTADMTALDFDSVNPDGTAKATISYRCETNSNNLLGRVTVGMCFAIGPGPGATSVWDRRMTHSSGEIISFQMYKDPALSNVWGDTSSPPSYLAGWIEYWTIFGSRTVAGTLEVHGKLLSNPPLVGAGEYSSFFSDARLIYSASESNRPNPLDCDQGNFSTDTFPFTARITVRPSCSVITASDMSFNPGGMPLSGTRTGNLASTSTIDLTCTKRTSWQVGLDDGLHATAGGTRQMCNPDGACIAYRLNRTSGTNPWGDDIDVNTVEGTSAGTSQSLTVHGRVDDQPLLQAGRYSDTVKVVLTY